jgi:hypothetical protein
MIPSPSLRPRLLTAALGCALFCCAAGCDDSDDSDAADGPPPQQSRSTASGGNAADGGTPASSGALVAMSEPQENAFTVKIPEGWKHRLAVVQVYDQKRPVVTAIKPGGDAFLFLGDPQMPSYALPTPQFNSGMPLANANPLLKIAPFQPAKQFFPEYLKRKFGKLPDFRIVGVAPNPRLEQVARAAAQRNGLQGKITATLIAFDYRDNGKLIRSLINGMTLQVGTIWVADLNGVSTSGDPTTYNDLLLRVAESFRMNPEWQARQREESRQRHEATMAMIRANTEAMTRRHEANMAAIQASAARHQERMAALHAAGDAQMNAWKEQQAQNDVSHERFLNYVKGEETVVNSGGATFQVESGQDRYFRNKSQNTFIGTDSTKELEDLRKVWGLNPDDYEEVKAKR